MGRHFLAVHFHMKGCNYLGIDTKRVCKLYRLFDKIFAKRMRALPRDKRQRLVLSRCSRNLF